MVSSSCQVYAHRSVVVLGPHNGQHHLEVGPLTGLWQKVWQVLLERGGEVPLQDGHFTLHTLLF